MWSIINFSSNMHATDVNMVCNCLTCSLIPSQIAPYCLLLSIMMDLFRLLVTS